MLWLLALMVLTQNGPCERVSKRPELMNLTLQQVLDKLGPPDKHLEFDISKAVTEFRIELQNTFALDSHVLIREYWWQDGACVTTLWLVKKKQRWTVFETCHWPINTNF